MVECDLEALLILSMFQASLFARVFIRNEAALQVVLNVVSGLLLFKVVSLWKIWRYIINIFEVVALLFDGTFV